MKKYTEHLNENSETTKISDKIEIKIKDGKYEDSVFLHFAIKVREILSNIKSKETNVEFKPGETYISSNNNNIVVVADDQSKVAKDQVLVYNKKDNSKKPYSISKTSLRKTTEKDIIKPEEQKPEEQKLLTNATPTK